MAEFPALPLWTDAYLGDTAHLTNEEHGVYLKLLMFAWRTPDCCLPDDDRRLAIMTGLSDKKWRTMKPVIAAFFTLGDGVWQQKRLTRERNFVRGKSEKNRDAAAARWKANDMKANDTVDADASLGHMPERCQTDAPIPIPIEEASANAAAASSAPPQQARSHPEWTADRLHAEVMAAVGLTSGPMPTHWLPPAGSMHVWRWHHRDGIPPDMIVTAAQNSRAQHDQPPSGPKALDRVMAALSKAIRDGTAIHSNQGASMDEKRAKWRKIAGAAP